MKKFRILGALALMLCLLVGLLPAQAEEFKAVDLVAAYRISDNRAVFEFSEPIKLGGTLPCIDVRMTSTLGGIIPKRDEAGNLVDYYRWRSLNYQYLDHEHDKIVLTLGGATFDDLYAGNWDGCTAAIKEKIDKGTYRFLIGIEEEYLTSPNEQLRDGMLKNLVSEADPNVYVWPNRLDAGECAYWWVDELLPKPADLVVDEAKFESMSGKGQDWDHEIIKLAAAEESIPEQLVVKNDPLVIAAILSAGVLVVLVVLIVTLLSKRKAGSR